MLKLIRVLRDYQRCLVVAVVVVACGVAVYGQLKDDPACLVPLAGGNETIELRTGSYQAISTQAGNATKPGCASAVFQRRRVLGFISVANKSNRTALWHCIESEGWASSLNPDADVAASLQGRVYRLAPLLSREEVESLLADVRSRQYQTDSDTVDGMPTYETYLYRRGKALASSNTLNVLCPLVARRVLPFVRARFDCPGCVLCHAFVRRYKVGERQHLPLHQDVMAYITAVIPLTPSSLYTGGLVVKVGEQEKCSEGWLRSISLDAGEAVVHGYDVAHLVHVSTGERFALALWIQPNSTACQEGMRHTR